MIKSVISILVTWVVGIIWMLYAGSYPQGSFLFEAANIIAGGAALLIYVVPVPLIVALVEKYRSKQFPHTLFSNLTYTLLVVFALMLFVGSHYLKSAI
jgi:uncharacterized membrane protein YjdF